MDYRKFGNTIIARFDKGEEIFAKVKEVALKENIKLASIEALGATDDFTVGVFDAKKGEYVPNSFTGAHEIVSLHGTITTKDNEYYCHLHLSAGDNKGNVVGGHLQRAIISATCEMMINVIDGKVEREYSEEVGINLLKFI